MKRTDKGYLYKGYELNSVIDLNTVTFRNQIWGWKVVDPTTNKTISPYTFDRLRKAKEYVDRITEVANEKN